jgi:hypothetical protein
MLDHIESPQESGGVEGGRDLTHSAPDSIDSATATKLGRPMKTAL